MSPASVGPHLVKPVGAGDHVRGPADAPVTLVEYLEATEGLWAYARRILGAWRDNEVLLTPTLTRLPAPVGGMRSQAGVTDDATRFSALVRLWNITGQPAMNLPLHVTAEGVPVGVQLVGPPGRDDLLITLARQLETSHGWRPQAPARAPAPTSTI